MRRIVHAVLLTTLLVPVVTANGASAPECFGAASLDRLKPCRNTELDRMVRPSPTRALELPNAPCTIRQRTFPTVCHAGVPEREATRFVALIGDSHAVHWAAATGPVASRRGWHEYRLSRLGCPLSFSTPILHDKAVQAACLRWRPAVYAWLRAHPKVDTVIVSQHRPRVKGGVNTEAAGYIRAWRALPTSVKHVIVVRDTPANPKVVRSCVRAALAAGRAAGRRCAAPRKSVLKVDPAALAATRARQPRVKLVDMTRYFCGAARCFPVIGGALVHKDESHITATYAETLAPMLGRRLDALLKR